MPLPKTPCNTLLIPTLSTSNPLPSGDNSNVTLHLKQPPRYTPHSKHQPHGAAPQLPGETGSPETQTLFREALKHPAPPRRQTTTPAQPDTRGDERNQRLLLPEVLLPVQAAPFLSHQLPVNLCGAGVHWHQLLGSCWWLQAPSVVGATLLCMLRIWPVHSTKELPIPKEFLIKAKTRHHLLPPWAAVMMQGLSPWGCYCARRRGKDDRLKPTAGPAPCQAMLHCICRKCRALLLGS